MNITFEFIMAQILGLFALIVLLISFSKKDKDELLKYQIMSSLLFGLQYLLLNAITGFLMNIVCMIRNYIFSRYKKIPIYYLIIVIILMVTLGLISYRDYYSLLPIIAVILYSIALYKGNTRIIRIIELISCSLFIIYNIHVDAYVGLISTMIEFLGCLVIFIEIDIIKKCDGGER